MTWVSDSTSLVSGTWVSSDYAGNGITGAALRASTGTGSNGPGILFNDWDTGDDASEFRYLILTYPSAGTLVPYEDGSFSFTAPDGTYTWMYQLYVNYVPVGTAVTVTMTIGAGSFIGNITLNDIIITSTLNGGTPSSFSASLVLNKISPGGTFQSDGTSSFVGNILLAKVSPSGAFQSAQVSEFDGNVSLNPIAVIGSFYSSGSGRLDPSTPLGRVRLKIGDYSDLPILPDPVIYSTLAEYNNNVNQTAQVCAQYILGILTSRTHKRIAQLETWSGEQFSNYVQFLKLTVLNPNLTTVAPVPYSGATEEDHPIQNFVDNWKTGYLSGSVVIPPQTSGKVIEYGF